MAAIQQCISTAATLCQPAQQPSWGFPLSPWLSSWPPARVGLLQKVWAGEKRAWHHAGAMHDRVSAAPGRPQFRWQLAAAASGGGAMPAKSLEEVTEMDKLIDRLLDADSKKLPQLVAENVLAFNSSLWLRLASRADMLASPDDKADMHELVQQCMRIVDRISVKSQEKIDDNANVLEGILDAAADSSGEWHIPLSRESIDNMRQALLSRQEYLDETFMASVFAYLRKVADGRFSDMAQLLQRVLQLFAAWYLTKHPRGRLKKSKTLTPEEAFLERLIEAEQEDWEPLIRDSLIFAAPPSKTGDPLQAATAGSNDAAKSPAVLNQDKFFKAVQRRIERAVLYMENGSYSQRVIAEYLKEIQTRAQNLATASRAVPPSQA